MIKVGLGGIPAEACKLCRFCIRFSAGGFESSGNDWRGARALRCFVCVGTKSRKGNLTLVSIFQSADAHQSSLFFYFLSLYKLFSAASMESYP